MLQFLQTGKVLYVLATVCVLGIISKLVTSSLYKRLIKETGNMALTKNKNLRAFKQKTENMFLVSHGIRNPGAYIEKQVYEFRCMKASLDGWDNLSVQMMLLCFMIGGVAAFGAYWYRCDSYYIVLYGTMGILSGLFMVFVDNCVNISGKRQQLVDCLIDYVENSPHFYRSVDRAQENADMERKGKAGIREIGRKGAKITGTAAGRDAVDRDAAFRETAAVTEGGIDNKNLGERQNSNGRLSVLSRKKDRKESAVHQVKTEEPRQKSESREDELSKSIDYLKQSLEQIAASREQGMREVQASGSSENGSVDRAKKELKPEDLKLLGEILQEYLT